MRLTSFGVGKLNRTYLDGVDRFRSPFIIPIDADDRERWAFVRGNSRYAVRSPRDEFGTPDTATSPDAVRHSGGGPTIAIFMNAEAVFSQIYRGS
jgi:hypothetical protein